MSRTTVRRRSRDGPRGALLRAFGCVAAAAALALVPARSLANWTSDPTVNLPVCAHTAEQQMPTLLPDGYGGAWIVWSDTRVAPNHADIYAQHVLAPGVVDAAWPDSALAVCTAWSAQMEPVIVTDGAGGMLIGWWDQRVAATNPDVYFQHVLATGAVDPAWPVNGAPVVISLDNQYPPIMLADGAGGAFFFFGDNDGTSNNVYAQHMLGSGDRDPGWSDNGLRLCYVIGDQLFPSAVSDGAAGMLVGWGDTRASVGGVYATRVLPSGLHPDWPVNGLAVCTSPIDIGSVKLAPDGSGGAIIAWSDRRTSATGDLYAQHLLASGAVDPTWPPGGVPVCTALNDQVVPQMVSDGTHGAIVVWWDKRSGNFDLYAHHILATGTLDPAWPADGRALVIAPGDQQASKYGLFPDGAGGALCVWRDGRTGALTRDVYATRILASGALDPTWPAGGLPVCTASGNQGTPAACPDGSGGLIATWADQRLGTFDIFAQRIAANGTLPNVGVGDRTETALRIDTPRPNPAREGTVFSLSLAASDRTRVEIFDVGGRVVRMLADEDVPAGAREIHWDLRDGYGRRVTPGLYLVRVAAGRCVVSSRVVVFE